VSSADLALLPVFLPLAGAAFALAAKALHGGRAARALEAAGAVVGLVFPWIVLAFLFPLLGEGGISSYVGSWHPGIGIAQRFDGLAWLVDVLGFAGAGAAYLFSRGAGPRSPYFTALFLIQTSALAATASTADLFNLFVCLELIGLASYALVASAEKGGSFLAAFSYLAVSSAAMVFFLFGLLGLYRLTGTLSYRGIAEALSAMPEGGGPAAALSVACIATAVAVRCAVMPVYGWLPEAHAQAPHAVSAVLSGVLIKTPLFALCRLLAFLPQGPRAMELIGYAGTATAVLAVLLALSQQDAKRLLAYHSISQIGYVVAAWGLGNAAGLSAAYLHALFHALFKGLLFLSVGAAIDAGGNRNVYSLRGCAEALRTAGDRRGTISAGFFVGALSIAAVPPFNGFASKAALGALFTGDIRYWALFAAGIGTVASFAKLARIFLPRREEPEHALPAGAFRVTRSMEAAVLILAGLCVATGVIAGPLLRGVSVLVAASDLPAIAAAPGAANAAPGSGPFTASELAKSAATVLLGGLVFAAAATERGNRAARALRTLPRSFSGLIVAFCAALVGLGAYLIR